MKKHTHKNPKNSNVPDNLWQAALHVIWGWSPVLRNIILALSIVLVVALLIWGTLPDKTKTDILSAVWTKANTQSRNSPIRGSSEKIVVAFELPTGISSATLIVKTESGQEVITINMESHNRQTISLPPGSYRYELSNITIPAQSRLRPCYESFDKPTQGNFTVDKNKNNTVLLPEIEGIRPIPGCTPSHP